MNVVLKIEVKTKTALIIGGALLAVWSGVAHGGELIEILQILAKKGEG
jgi:hypothetical protein